MVERYGWNTYYVCDYRVHAACCIRCCYVIGERFGQDTKICSPSTKKVHMHVTLYNLIISLCSGGPYFGCFHWYEFGSCRNKRIDAFHVYVWDDKQTRPVVGTRSISVSSTEQRDWMITRRISLLLIIEMRWGGRAACPNFASTKRVKVVCKSSFEVRRLLLE